MRGMNPFLKHAYDLGARKALEDQGITKESFNPLDASKLLRIE